MARLKNSTFTGTVVPDGDVDAPTFTRVMREAQSDLALIYDKLTGLNAETVLIDHQGDVKADALRGCPLGIPIANQFVGADLSYENPTDVGGAKDGATGDTFIIAVPFFQPTAEASFTVRLTVGMSGLAPASAGHALVYSTAGAIVEEQPIVVSDDENAGDVVLTSDLTVTAGLRFLLVALDTDRRVLTPDFELDWWTLAPHRLRSGPGMGVRRKTTDDVGVTTPAANEALAWRDIDASLCADLMPLSAYLVAGANRNANGLYEYLTGHPAGDDASYTHVDHDGAAAPDDVNPARPRFHGGQRELAGYPAAPLFEFPVHCEAFGALQTNGLVVVDAYSSATQAGMTGWQPIIPSRKTKTTVHQAFVTTPDFPAGASSNLKWAVFACFTEDPSNGSGNGPGAWTAYIDTGTGAEGSSVFARMGTTAFAYASGSALDFAPDATQAVQLKIEKTGAAAKATIREIQVLGWCLYYDP